MPRRPTDTRIEPYNQMRRALLATGRNDDAFAAVLQEQPDGGDWWIALAYHDLRQALTLGKLTEGTRMGELIARALRLGDPTSRTRQKLASALDHAMEKVIGGISAYLDCDYAGAQPLLHKAATDDETDVSLRWLAWLWLARARGDVGDIEPALAAARRSLDLAAKLHDGQTRSSSLCAVGELQFAAGDRDGAMASFGEAEQIFDKLADHRGKATVFLGRAQLEAATGHGMAAIESATQARHADPRWHEPVLFLARQALSARDPEQAEWVLSLLHDVEPRPPEIAREIRLLGLLREGTLDPDLVAEYSRLRDQPPTEEVIVELTRLARATPQFWEARELLGWALFKRGRDLSAREHFEALAKVDLPPELQGSVLLGLGCVTNRLNRDRRTGARLHAATTAIPDGSRDLAISVLESYDDDEPTGPLTDFDQLNEKYLDRTFVAPRGNSLQRMTSGAEQARRVALTGNLATLGVPDLLEFLRAGRRTGTLVVTSGAGIGAIHLRQGMITGVASPHGESIGRALVRQGRLEASQLAAARRHQRKNRPDHLLGALLVDLELLDVETVREALIDQARQALSELVGWTHGGFAFDPDNTPAPNDSEGLGLELDVQQMLLDVLDDG